MAVRVLLADDQAMVRTGFRMILELEDDMEVVGEAQDGEEANAAARRTHADVIVMDVRMPRLDGLEATRRCAPERPASCSRTRRPSSWSTRSGRSRAATGCSRPR